MKISYHWLKQYLNIEQSPEVVAEALTSAGLEVEEIITFESVKGGLQGIVTGVVLSCEKHPNADKLSLTKVDVGADEPLSIVCGAPNVATGQKVLVATIGATLHQGDDSFQIKKSKIRGELSEGMICAEDELGLGKSHDGIMVLNPETLVGQPATTYFPVENDWIFEIGLTPNRSDAASHIGVARDLAAILNYRFETRRHTLQFPDVSSFSVDDQSLDITVEVPDTEACPRYSGLTISDIHVGPSPEWLKNKLKAIGVRPINNIVDITNYVLFETGQPLHAFDASAIKGHKVVVKKLPVNTPFVTLDGIERKLNANDLMICNAEEGMCIGGVFGGLNSGVNENTTAIFLESACFDSKTIRKTARAHGLQTDASFRFERGTDPNITVFALKRAALLIKEIAGGRISSEIKDVYPQMIKPAQVNLNFEYLNKIAGQNIDSTIAIEILKDLDINVLNQNTTEALLEIPTFKVDVYRPADVVEEVLRVYGYDNIRIPEKLNASVNISEGLDPDKLQHSVADLLAANGFYEMMNNSLTRSDYTGKHPAFDVIHNVVMLNPLSKDLDVLRQSLLFGGLETIAYNQNRKSSDLKFFEFGKVYRFDPSKKSTEQQVLAPYHEQLQLDLFITGEKEQENWDSQKASVDFFDLKQMVEGVIKKLRIPTETLSIEQFTNNIFETGLSYHHKNELLVQVGLLNSITTKPFDIKKEVFYASFNWELLLASIPKKTTSFQPISKYPSVRRDLALVVDQHIRFESLRAIAFKTEPKLLQDVKIFDVYEGDKIPTGKKSYALGFLLLDKDMTLTDKVIDKTMQKLQAAFEQQTGASLR